MTRTRRVDARRDAGLFSAVTQVRNEVIEPALQAVLDEVTGMAKAPVPERELTRTKNFISGMYRACASRRRTASPRS